MDARRFIFLICGCLEDLVLLVMVGNRKCESEERYRMNG